MKVKYQLGDTKVIVIAILVLLLLAAAGYIIYEKLITRPSNDDSNSMNTQIEKTETTETEVATQEVCAPHEKICFKYPAEGWEAEVVESSYPKPPTDEIYAKTDEVSIKSSEAIVYIDSGIIGIESHCEAGTSGRVYIIRQQKTNLKGYSTEYNQSAEAYAMGIVHQMTDGKYLPRIGLTNDKTLIDKSEADGCSAAKFGLVETKNITYSSEAGGDQAEGYISVSERQFFGTSESLKLFDTLEEAKKMLDSEANKQVFDIIASGYYK